MSRFLLCVAITALVVLGSQFLGFVWMSTVSGYANPTWPRNPTDDEINQALSRFLESEGPVVKEHLTVKYHRKDIQPVRDGYNANEVAVFWMKKYSADGEPEFGSKTLECVRDPQGDGCWIWSFSGGGCWAPRATQQTFSSLRDFVAWCISGNYEYGWVSGEPGGPPPSENHPPTVSLSYSPPNPTTNDTIYFTAVASDPDGDDLTYRWFLNGVEQTNATAPHVQWANPSEGTYTIRVVVSDGKGGMAEDSLEFTVQPARPRYVIMKGTGDLEGEEPLAFVEKIEVDGKITESRTSLYKGAYVKTGPGVEIVIRFASGVVVRVKENTNYEVEGVKFSGTPQAVIYTRLIEGLMNFWFKGRELEQKFEVEANRVVVGIKGTEGTIKLISGITTVTVTEGEVEVRDKITGAASTVRAGETVSFGGTPPPGGAKTIEQAIDADGDGIINDLEMLQALQYWIKQQIVPGTNKTIDDLTMLSLLQRWIKGTPVR